MMLNVSSAYAPLINFDIAFFLQIINTLVLFGFLSWKLYKPVTKILEDRKQSIAKSYDDAEAATKEAEELKLKYEQKLAEAKAERASIIGEARDTAQKTASEIVRHAEEEARLLKEKAEQQIEADKQKAMLEVKDDIAAMAVLAAAQILKKEVDSDSNRKMIREFIDGVGDVTWDK